MRYVECVGAAAMAPSSIPKQQVNIVVGEEISFSQYMEL